MTNQIVELHLHTDFSPLDGLNKPSEYMKRAKELGMTHLAQTDHGTLSGHRSFQRAAKEAGIIPILGLEAYISPTDRFDRRTKANRGDGTSAYNHIILLSTGEEGLSNLNRLSQIGWTEGFYNKPRIDFAALAEYKDGLIILSGCLGGLISQALERQDFQEANALAAKFKAEFGDAFYIEVQSENPSEINMGLLTIADAHGIKPVITGDCHYADPKDRWIEEAFLILATNPKRDKGADFTKSQKLNMLDRFNYLYPDRRMTFQNWDLFLAGREHRYNKMAAMGVDRLDIYDNTNEIASRIGDYPYYENLDLLPKPRAADPFERLTQLYRDGLRRLKLSGIPEYEERGQMELDIIKSKNFASYFLILANMISWGRSKGIRFGPGRGSGTSSLVNYALNITQVDPIKENLLFSRFLDESRNDWPDIDVDVQDNRRHELKEYARKQFKNVASITTVTIYQEKASLKAACRVFGIEFSEANRIVKNIESFEEYKRTQSEFHRKYPEVLDLAERLEGRISGYGMHAGGLVVSKEPIANYVPIETRSDANDKVSGRIPVVAYDMNEIAEIGLIKYDLLGLKALTIVDDCINSIFDRTGRKIELLDIPMDDQNVFKMLSDGYTKGVFQAEQPAMTSLLIKLGVHNFEDIVVANALVRPGAMNVFGQDYIACKNGKKQPVRIHESVDKYMENTYFMPIYQEQSMFICAELAGLGMVTANKIRKVTAKKQDPILLAEYKQAFIDGATPKVGQEKAAFLWDSIEETASYQFNRCHSVPYGMMTYWTAWLKHHYPVEFMHAILSNEKDKDSITDYLIEAKRLGIKIKLPHVNESALGFSIQGNAIRFGLKNVKFISDKTGAAIMQHRPFDNYASLKEKVDEKGSGLNSRILQALNAVGGASFHDNPRTGRERDNFYEYLGIPAFEGADLPPKIKAQFIPLDEYSETGAFPILAMVRSVTRKDGWARVDVVDETGSTGIFTDGETPIEAGQLYAILVSNNRVARYVPFDDLVKKVPHPFTEYLYRTHYPSVVPGQFKVLSFQRHITKAGKRMAYVVLSTEEKELVPCMVFPQQYMQGFSHLKDNAVVAVEFGQTQDGSTYITKFL